MGNFSLTFEDVTLPLAGLPITLTRTYDTRTKHRAQAFGQGWRPGYETLRLEESGRIAPDWQINNTGGALGQFCVQPNGDRLVTVDLPDGRVESFKARAEPECSPLVPIVDVKLVLDPIGSTQGKLEQTDYPHLRLANGDLINPGDPGEAVDPRHYWLTTPEGLVYELDQDFGVRRLIEPNGNTVEITAAGITHSSGIALTFQRDAAGRITAVTLPDGSGLHYVYDAAGDLISVTDRAGATTTFKYDADHTLTEIIDPRGVRVARNLYDDSGRLIGQIDAEGHRLEYEHDVPGRRELVRDRRGNATLYVYDDRGNVLAQTNARNETITHTYDEDDNELTRTDALNHTTRWTYDGHRNQLSETDPLGRTTRRTYTPSNQLETETDALDRRVLNNHYNFYGDLDTITDALGHTTRLTYDIWGGPETLTDAAGNVTVFNYGIDGRKRNETDVLGATTEYTYDAAGNVLSEKVSYTDAEGERQSLTTTYQYDGAGRLTDTIDPQGAHTRTEYTDIGQEAAHVDALGRRTEYQYDARGNRVLTRYPDGSTETAAFDPNGNRIAETDRAGHTTRYEYDAANRLISTTYPDGTHSARVYDAAGRLVEDINPNDGHI